VPPPLHWLKGLAQGKVTQWPAVRSGCQLNGLPQLSSSPLATTHSTNQRPKCVPACIWATELMHHSLIEQ
jgi:hypothetical protein